MVDYFLHSATTQTRAAWITLRGHAEAGSSLVWVRCWSGGGPMWIVQMPDIKALARMIFWLWESLSAPCVDGPGTAQPRRRPGESPMWIAQTIGIKGFVVVTLTAGEVHVAFSLALVASGGLTRAKRVQSIACPGVELDAALVRGC